MKTKTKVDRDAIDASVKAMTGLLRGCGDVDTARACAQAALNAAFLPTDSVMAFVRIFPDDIIAATARR